MKCRREGTRCKVQGTSGNGQAFQRLKMVGLFLPFIFLSCFVFAQEKAIQQGNNAYRKNDFSTAIKDYTKALSEDNKNEIAKFNMANALQRTNEHGKSASVYDDVIKNTTDAGLQSKAYYNKALAMLQQDKLNEAIDALKQSLRLQPMDNDARENLQKALEQKQQQQPPQQTKQNQKKQQNQKGQKQQQMNRQMMERKFKELEDQEKQLQKELQKQKTNTADNEQDW